MPNWYCVLCRYRELSRVEPTLCERCGGTNCFGLEETVDFRSQSKSADEWLKHAAFNRVPTGDSILDKLLMGGIVEGATVLLWGKGGSGKSRLALRWSSHIGTSQIWSLEMAGALTAFSAQSAGADMSKLIIEEQITPMSELYKVIVLDSLSELPPETGQRLCAELKTWAKRTKTIVFVIVHITKGGEYAGRGWIRHWPDYEFRVSQARKVAGTRVSVLKSRFSPLGDVVVPLVAKESQSTPPRETP